MKRKARRPYKAPRLVDYGAIPARTLSMATGSASDGTMLMVM